MASGRGHTHAHLRTNALQDSKAIILPVAGNIAASYNFCNIGYAVQLMRLEHPVLASFSPRLRTFSAQLSWGGGPGSACRATRADRRACKCARKSSCAAICAPAPRASLTYGLPNQVPRWAAPAFASSCLCGAVVGQLLLGWFGDRFGRRPAMVIAMGLVVFGALGSAIMTTGYGDFIWKSLVAWRFILGIGLGGTYPLTAVIAGEMNDERGLGRTRRVALSIAVQIVGNILAPVLMLVVLILLGTDRVTEEPWATELGWRFLLAIGALPGVVALKEILFNSGTDSESHEYLNARGSGGVGRLRDVINALSPENKFRNRLIGCAGGWACFDACFFGFVIFLPHLVHDLLDKNDEARGYLMLNALVSAVTTPRNPKLNPCRSHVLSHTLKP